MNWLGLLIYGSKRDHFQRKKSVLNYNFELTPSKGKFFQKTYFLGLRFLRGLFLRTNTTLSFSIFFSLCVATEQNQDPYTSQQVTSSRTIDANFSQIHEFYRFCTFSIFISFLVNNQLKSLEHNKTMIFFNSTKLAYKLVSKMGEIEQKLSI